jgi:hypothetical protein
MITILTLSLTAGQGPLFVEVKVKVTSPAAMSDGAMEYTLFRNVFDGLKAPGPELDQIPELVPNTNPGTEMVGVVEHKAWFGPVMIVAG